MNLTDNEKKMAEEEAYDGATAVQRAILATLQSIDQKLSNPRTAINDSTVHGTLVAEEIDREMNKKKATARKILKEKIKKEEAK